MASCCLGAFGQAIGVEVVVDTAFYGPNTPTPDDDFDPEGLLDGYVSYLVYAKFQNPTDVLSAVFADENALLEGGALSLDAPCGCWNPITSSMIMNDDNNSLLWGIPGNELLKYDTFWTIGKLSSDEPGGNATWVSNPPIDGSNICDSSVEDGSIFLVGASNPVNTNALAGDDLSVVVARITTCGNWSLNLNLQVFVEGSTEDIFYLNANGGPIQQEDVCGGYDDEEPMLTGLDLPCYGDVADVEMEFLGVDEDLEETLYTLVTFDSEGAVTSEEETESRTFEDLGPGKYEVLVSNTYGCYDTVQFEVVEPAEFVVNFDLVDDNECDNEADAVVYLSDDAFSGGTLGLGGTPTFDVRDPLGNFVVETPTDTGIVWDGLACVGGSGQFVFLASDLNGCEVVDTIQVNCPAPIEWSVEFGDLTCHSDLVGFGADGFIVAEATGGSDSLYLNIGVEEVPLAEGFVDLTPSTYQVHVRDVFNCTSDTVEVTIEQPDAIKIFGGSGVFDPSVDVTEPECGLDCNGAIAITAEGGTGPLNFTFYNLDYGTTSTDSTGLCAGEYRITVTDTVGCLVETVVDIDAPDELGFLITAINATCTGMSNGSALVYPYGGDSNTIDGVPQLDLLVVDTAGNEVNLTNLSEMTYLATVTDQVGCTHSETFDIGIDVETDMEVYTLTSPVTCWNAADGTATVSVKGGQSPFTYEWSDPYGQTTATAVGLTEDTYTVVVRDALGCRRTASQDVDAIEGCLFIPDALTPNGDNKNDDWIVGGLEDYPESEVSVYNRWGQRVFFSVGGKERWDGKLNAMLLPVADYHYTIDLFPGALPIRGTVTLKY